MDHNTFVSRVERAHNTLTQTLDEKDINGRCALHILSYFGTPELAEVLISHSADVTAIDNQGYTPAHYAAMADNVRVLERLFLAKADVFAKTANSGRTPLHTAASCGSLQVVKFLYRVADEEGYDPCTTDSNKRTPLWLAIFYKHNTVASFLYSQSDRVLDFNNKDSINFLFRACVKTPRFATELMNSRRYKYYNKDRRVGALWLNNIAKLEDDRDTTTALKDSTLGYVNMFGIDMRITNEPFMRQYIEVCWMKFARKQACIELLAYLMFSTLSTIYYIVHGMMWSYNSVMDEKPPHSSDLGISFILLTVLWTVSAIILLLFDVRKIYNKARYHSHAWDTENKTLAEEKKVLHPFMRNMSLLLKVEQDALDAKQGILGAMSLMRYNLWDFTIHLLCLIIFVVLVCMYNLTQPLDSTHTVFFGVSILLMDIWVSTFLVLRLIPQTGGFVVALYQMCGAMWQFCILYATFFIPFAMIMWKTIYSWSTIHKLNIAVEINGTAAFYTVFRMSVADYDYNIGNNIAQVVGCTLWWDILVVAWIIISNIVLLNLLIALMSTKFSGAYEKINHHSLQNRLWWCQECQMCMSQVSRDEFKAYLTSSKCAPFIYHERHQMAPDAADPISDIDKDLSGFHRELKGRVELLNQAHSGPVERDQREVRDDRDQRYHGGVVDQVRDQSSPSDESTGTNTSYSTTSESEQSETEYRK